jgi:hypothetical protein
VVQQSEPYGDKIGHILAWYISHKRHSVVITSIGSTATSSQETRRLCTVRSSALERTVCLPTSYRVLNSSARHDF